MKDQDLTIESKNIVAKGKFVSKINQSVIAERNKMCLNQSIKVLDNLKNLTPETLGQYNKSRKAYVDCISVKPLSTFI